MISYQILSEAMPTQLTAMVELLSHEEVRWTKVNLRGMLIGVITHRVHYEHGDCEDLEYVCAWLVRCMVNILQGSGRCCYRRDQ